MAEQVKRQGLRMPGRVLRWFVIEAQRQMEMAADTDLCEAISEPRIRRVGRGWRVTLLLELDQTERLMDWVSDSAPAHVRDYRDNVQAALALHRSAASTQDGEVGGRGE